MVLTTSRPAPDTTIPADPCAPATRLAGLLDHGSLTITPDPAGSGVVTAAGRIGDHPVIAYCTDATQMGGALGAAGASCIVSAIGVAAREQCPVIGLWHSGGARIREGVESMDAVGRMFTAMTQASGLVPQISVVLGPAAGAGAYGPGLTDLIIMSEEGRLFVTGPDVIRKVTGEDVSMQALGGAEAHGPSGVVHILTALDREAFAAARAITSLLAAPGRCDPGSVPEGPVRETRLAQLAAAIHRESGGVERALALGVVDEVIDPRHTRRRLAEAFAGLPSRRGRHGNIPL